MHCDGTPITDKAQMVRVEGTTFGAPIDWNNDLIVPDAVGWQDVNFNGSTAANPDSPFKGFSDSQNIDLTQIGARGGAAGFSGGGGGFLTQGGGGVPHPGWWRLPHPGRGRIPHPRRWRLPHPRWWRLPDARWWWVPNPRWWRLPDPRWWRGAGLGFGQFHRRSADRADL